ncbi:hypothetical protein [Cupriavidus sp. CuC1]|uniref:hypothetical protein n=1 Tax=Cupriavidus sp. CuC1 TaxID=3373131 RepID=UPI0037D68D4D
MASRPAPRQPVGAARPPRMKYRLLRPRRGSLSGSLAVRSHLPWPLRVLGAALMLVVVLVVAVVAAGWAYDAGRRLTGAPHMTAQGKALHEQVAAMTAQRERLQAVANTAEAQLQMARSAQEALAGQLKTAEGEVAQLKEDLAFLRACFRPAAIPPASMCGVFAWVLMKPTH